MPIIAAHMLDFISHSPEQTQRTGTRLAELVEPGDVIALHGELGSGKTQFVKGLARGLGTRESVHSPTFILANEYRTGRLPLYHVDAYRVADTAEAFGFGFDDYLHGYGVTVIEWADRIREALPAEHLRIEFRYISETKRRITLQAHGRRYERMLEEFKARAFG